VQFLKIGNKGSAITRCMTYFSFKNFAMLFAFLRIFMAGMLSVIAFKSPTSFEPVC
jgi:hypothetical protein